MRAGALLLTAVAVVLMIPTATANVCWKWVEVEVAVDEAVVEVAIGYVGQPAADLRERVDNQFGDGDGHVRDDEADSFEDRLSRQFEDPDSDCVAGLSMVRFEDAAPRGIHELSVHTDGIRETDAASRQQARLAFSVELDFDDELDDAVTATVRLSRVIELRTALLCEVGDLNATPWGDHPCGQSATDGWSQMEYVRLGPASGHRLVGDTVDPSSTLAHWRSGGLENETAAGAVDLLRTDVRVDVVEDGAWPASWPATGAWAGGALAVLAFAAVLAVPHWRFLLLRRIAALPGFSRIRRDEALDHERRESIVHAVRANPGLSLADLRRRTEIPRGSLAYHVRVLERHDLLRSRRHGVRTRFWPLGASADEPYLTDVQERLLGAIRAEPGRTQKELAKNLQLPRKTVAYNADRLQDYGKIAVQADGVWRRHYPTEE